VTRPRLACLGVAALVVAAAAPATARGESAPILLPSVRTSLTPGPPLPGANTASTEVLFPPGLTSDERVLVGIDTSGNPTSIAVVQRLLVHKLGDYSFTVPGPITDVEVLPGSGGEPGLRRDAILWAGFSAGKKTLAARATLRVAPAAAVLPLKVTIERDGNAMVVRGRNTSAAPGPVLIGSASVRDVSKAFEETRRGLRLGRGAPDVYVGTPDVPVSQSQPIAAPLDVRGNFGGEQFRYRLGDGGPMEFSFRAAGAAPNAKLRLVVTPVAPMRLLAPPRAATWAEAVRLGRVDPAQLLERVSQARLTLARALQYQTFLANPNPSGASTGVYIYETAKRTAVQPPKVNDESAGSNPWRAVLLTAIAILGAGAAIVLWAHS
jgi:hypothetical protein